MLSSEHAMRTTLTLDDDIAAKLANASRTSGKPFKEVVNSLLRHALFETRPAKNAAAFVVQPQKMGALKAGFTLDKISAVLEEAEGPFRR